MEKKLKNRKCWNCTRQYNDSTSSFCPRCRLNKNNYVYIANDKIKKHYKDFVSIIAVRTNGKRGVKFNIPTRFKGNSTKSLLDDNFILNYLKEAQSSIEKDIELIKGRRK